MPLSLLANMLWADIDLHSHGDYFLLRQENPSVVPKQNPAKTRGEADVEFRGSVIVFKGWEGGGGGIASFNI